MGVALNERGMALAVDGAPGESAVTRPAGAEHAPGGGASGGSGGRIRLS